MMEILAPAGNIASLKVAIYNGANAVYLGLNNFNARAKANNFNEENLAYFVHFAHLFNVRVYCAFNTLIKDEEIKTVLSLIEFADKCKVDAIIVQDLGLIKTISSTMPHIVMHASTQMGIHNAEGAMVAEQLGVKRVILSRETLIEDIKKIHEKTSLEIEFFVQGALCVAFSGNCYFSSLVSGYSGNRGKCMQLCRKKYTLENKNNKKTGYYLSAKDLCLVRDLKALENAGVISIKIEGRLRSPEYVGECVRVYKKALQSNVAMEDVDALKTVFNRGDYCVGHLYNAKGSVIFPSIQNNIGVFAGTVKEIKNSVAFLNTTLKLSIGDGVKYLRRGEEVGFGLITNTNNSTSFKGDLQAGDEIRLTSSKRLIDEVAGREYKLKLKVSLVMLENELPSLTLEYNDIVVTVYGEQLVESSQKQPLTIEGIRNNLCKFGETFFYADDVLIKADDNIFYPVSKINALRRAALLKLENKMCAVIEKEHLTSHTMPHIEWNNCLYLEDKNNIFIQIDNLNVANNNILNVADYIIYNPNLYEIDNIKEFKNLFGSRAVLNLPLIARGKDVELLAKIIEFSGIDIFVVNNLYGINLCKNKKIIAGYGLNLLNDNMTITKINSLESEKYNYSNKNILYSYGYQMFMTLCHCPQYDLGKNCATCNNENKLSLSDERNSFYLRRIKLDNCYWQLLNTIPLNLIEEVVKMKKCNILFDFTSVVSVDEIDCIIKSYSNGNTLFSQHTHGNFAKKLY